ncbi:hypothetical protein ALC53_02476 [Atta colombica]|uniref:Uncharacterized protein n=1 Tax=Atta colombica TaxID=520822 RepID=A0A195BSG3_9HYME|nr:hypothetical protein ALC53_02476 [Atta colombica]
MNSISDENIFPKLYVNYLAIICRTNTDPARKRHKRRSLSLLIGVNCESKIERVTEAPSCTHGNSAINALLSIMFRDVRVYPKNDLSLNGTTTSLAYSIPHFVYNDECNVDLMRQNDMKDSLERGISLILMPFFIKTASRTLE